MDARPHDADEPAEDLPADEPETLADDPVGGDRRRPGSASSGDEGSGGAGDSGAGDSGAGDGGAGSADGRTVTDDPDDTEAQWQDLVARLRAMGGPDPETLGPGGTLGPDAEVGGASTVDGGPDTGAGPRNGHVVRDAWPAHRPGGHPPTTDAVAAPRGWSPDPAMEEAESHFEPPDPGPVLGGDPLLTLAWSAVVSVPIALLLVVMLWRDAPAVVLQVAGVAFVGGLGLLLWRMPHGDDDGSRGSGAVV